MTNKEILIKAISKAILNGCKYTTFDIDENIWVDHNLYYGVIFAHDFAKCFWGTHQVHPTYGDIWKPHERMGKIYGSIPCWQWHLSKIVISKNPLKYLEKYL